MQKLGWLFVLVIGSCASPDPAAPPEPIGNNPPPLARPTQPSVDIPPAIEKPLLEPQSRLPLKYYNTTRNGIRMYLVAFDDRDYMLRVADQPKGVGSRWNTAKDAASTYGGVAAVNGGFFTPEGKPLGLLIETGTRRGYINKSSLGAGLYVSSDSGSSIIRRETYLKTQTSLNPYNLLQTGPMLAENRQPVSKFLKSNQRPRSFLAWDGRHHWVMGVTEPCSLGGLSKALAGRAPGGFDISTAVNLDGGRSSDLWVGSAISGGGKSHRGIFNKAVRNYLVLVRRK